jgi:threonine dehydrogenase-like Zn-dependent dehydrogenase
LMRALVIDRPGEARIINVEPPATDPLEATMRIRRIGLCGTDLSTFLGKNPLVSYPRIPGHEVAATLERVPANDLGLVAGMDVTMSPYTSCGKCTAYRQGRVNSCRHNQTLGVQRDGALMDRISMPLAKLYAAPLSIEELCLVEPLTVGCHAVARGRVTAADTVAIYGCGGVGLGAVAAAAFRDANVIAIDVATRSLPLRQKRALDMQLTRPARMYIRDVRRFPMGMAQMSSLKQSADRIHIARRSRRLPSRVASFTSDMLRIW